MVISATVDSDTGSPADYGCVSQPGGTRIAAKEGTPVYFTLLTSVLTPAGGYGKNSVFMVPLSQAEAADPSPFVKSIRGWLAKFICDTRVKQSVVGKRHKNDGSLVTQEEFDRKDRVAHVCPFIADSIDRDDFWVERSELTREQTLQIADRLSELISEFVSQKPAYDPRTTGKPAPPEVIWKCFLLYFPVFGVKKSSGSIREIDDLYKKFKPEYMAAGLGLGQFYAGCPAPGAYNPEFRPLISPVPAFAVRYLAVHDSVFNPEGSDFRAAYEKYFPPVN